LIDNIDELDSNNIKFNHPYETTMSFIPKTVDVKIQSVLNPTPIDETYDKKDPVSTCHF
jgi:hypothetical protein